MTEFDDVLREMEVGWDITEGNYDILRYYRDEYKDLLAEVKRLREGISALVSEMTTTVHFHKVSDETERQYAHSWKELIE